MEALRFDSVPLKAVRTREGYLRDSPVIARAGIQEYVMPGGRRVREYRPKDVVLAPAALAAVQGIPVVDLHPGQVDATNVREHAIGSVLSAGREDADGHMVADIVVYHTDPVTKHGRKELSLAYGVRVDETPGTTPDGQPFDQQITEITGFNHLGIVARGRAGVARLRLDSHDAVSVDLQTEETAVADPKLVAVRLDSGIAYDAVPEVAAAFQAQRDALRDEKQRADEALSTERTRAADALAAEKARADAALASEKSRADALEAERNTLKAAVDKHDDALKQARADAVAEVKARLSLEAEAGKHGVEVRADMSDRQVREAVVEKLNPGVHRFDAASDDYIAAAYRIETNKAETARDTAAQNRAKATGHAAPAPQRADAQDGKAPAGFVRSSAELLARIGRAPAAR